MYLPTGTMKKRAMRRATMTAHIGISVGNTFTQMHAHAKVTTRIQAYLNGEILLQKHGTPNIARRTTIRELDKKVNTDITVLR